MRNCLLFVSLVFLFGCSSTQQMARSVIVTGLDFRPYAERGFLFSPERYDGNFESRGVIKVQVIPQVKKLDFVYERVDQTAWVQLGPPSSVWVAERLDSKSVVEEVYKAATNMGADAVVRFEVSTREIRNGEILVPIYEATGFAIKRIK